jgi:hypothetical protein
MGKPSSFSINGVALTEIAQAAAQTCSEELLSPTRLQQRSAAQAMRSPAHATQAAVAKVRGRRDTASSSLMHVHHFVAAAVVRDADRVSR